MRPAARRPSRSPGRPRSASAVERRVGRPPSAMPAQQAAVRIASRENQGSRTSSPGPPSTASTGAPSNTTRWLSDVRSPAPAYQARSISTPPGDVDQQSAGRRASPSRAVTRARSMPPAPEQNTFTPRSAPAVARPRRAGGPPSPGGRVGAPDPHAAAAGGDRRQLVARSGSGASASHALHRVEVAVEDPRHRPVGPRHPAHERPTRPPATVPARGGTVAAEQRRRRSSARTRVLGEGGRRPVAGRRAGGDRGQGSSSTSSGRRVRGGGSRPRSRDGSTPPGRPMPSPAAPAAAAQRLQQPHGLRAVAHGGPRARCRRASAPRRRPAARGSRPSIRSAVSPAPVVGVGRPSGERQAAGGGHGGRPRGHVAPRRTPARRAHAQAREGGEGAVGRRAQRRGACAALWRTWSQQWSPTSWPSASIAGPRAVRQRPRRHDEEHGRRGLFAQLPQDGGVSAGSGPSSNDSVTIPRLYLALIVALTPPPSVADGVRFPSGGGRETSRSGYPSRVRRSRAGRASGTS